MADPNLIHGADPESLRRLPRLSAADREVLERLILLAPEMAVATASAGLRTHQGDLHDLFFPPSRRRRGPRVGRLAGALVYLALAMSAPSQGKFLPILSTRDFQVARRFADHLLEVQTRGEGPQGGFALGDLVPDQELVGLLKAFADHPWPGRDPRWVRAVVTTSGGAFYQVIAQVCAEQFRPAGDVEAAAQQLARTARTRELIIEALTPDEAPRSFDRAKREERIGRLREFGWHERVASTGRTLQEIAREGLQLGLFSDTQFALTEEWPEHGASHPTAGERYFIRPALLPDSSGLSLSAQEERLKPIQKVLGGDPSETGLRIGLGTVELFLEYVLRSGQREFLMGRWTRTGNQFDGLHTRFGLVAPDRFAVTLFPSSRRDDAVGVCPVITVAEPQ